jgi:sugar/nucleoside kinase (ribokinase family)
MTLLIVGSVALDSIRTPHGEVKRALGGSATYAGIAASFFTCPHIVGVVGDDFPQEYIDLMKDKNCDLAGLKIIAKGKTFHWEGYYEENMSQAHTVSTCLNVFEFFQPDLPHHYRKSDFVFLANIDPELQLHVLEQVKKPRLVMCDTMNYWIESKREKLMEVFRRSDVVLVNEGEARLLTDSWSLIHAAEKLLETGPSYVIIKKGEHGAFIMSRDDYFSLPAYPIKKIKDPTGAGDTFAGGFIGYLASQKRLTRTNFRRAMAVGTVLASFVCEDFSVRGTISLTNSALNKRLKEFYNHVRLSAVEL